LFSVEFAVFALFSFKFSVGFADFVFSVISEAFAVVVALFLALTIPAFAIVV